MKHQDFTPSELALIERAVALAMVFGRGITPDETHALPALAEKARAIRVTATQADQHADPAWQRVEALRRANGFPARQVGSTDPD